MLPLNTSVSKSGLFEQFIHQMHHFTKTGSGQTWGKRSKEGTVCTQAPRVHGELGYRYYNALHNIDIIMGYIA